MSKTRAHFSWYKLHEAGVQGRRVHGTWHAVRKVLKVGEVLVSELALRAMVGWRTACSTGTFELDSS